MAKPQNTFYRLGPVTEAEAFIGRTREFQAIFTRLESRQSISVVGPRRIGKSSLLWQAAQRISGKAAETPSPAANRLKPGADQDPVTGRFTSLERSTPVARKQATPETTPTASDYRPLYVDMQSAEHYSLDGLLGAILRGIDGDATELLALPLSHHSAKLAAFERAVRGQRAKGILPIILLDEFEMVAKLRDEFGDNLLDCWRYLGEHGQIAFVTASKHPLHQVEQAHDLTSSFHNIFSKLTLKEFTDQESQEFVARATRSGNFDPSDATFLLTMGQRHPLRLQVAAWHLFEAKRSGSVNFAELKEQILADTTSMLGQE